jgi:hypothetical protein
MRRSGLPGTIHFWWNVGLPVLTTLVAWVIAFIREAPLWSMPIIVIGVFSTAALLSLPAQRLYTRLKPGTPTSGGDRSPGTTINIAVHQPKSEELSAQRLGVFDPSTDWTQIPTKTILRKAFENERVELNGYEFVNCKFHNVTFVYKGEAPFYLLEGEISGSRNVVVGSWPLLIFTRMLYGLKYLNPSLDVGHDIHQGYPHPDQQPEELDD